MESAAEMLTFGNEITDEMIDETLLQSDSLSNADVQSNVGSYAESNFSRDGSPSSFRSGTPVLKKRKASQMETNDILREFLAQRPKPSDFLPQKPDDDIQQFFDSMASTVRKFSPLSIARIKLKIAQIVGEEEIAWAENAAREANQQVEYVYLSPTSILQQQTVLQAVQQTGQQVPKDQQSTSGQMMEQ